MLFLMPGREQKDVVITVTVEITTQLQRGNVSRTVNLGDAFLDTLCGYVLKGQEVNSGQGMHEKATGKFLDHSFGCEHQNTSYKPQVQHLHTHIPKWGRRWSSGVKRNKDRFQLTMLTADVSL